MAARLRLLILTVWLVAGLAGCATCPTAENLRSFQIGRDSIAYPNELLRTYVFHPDGRTTSHHADPEPDYALHCFPMVRAAREFFHHARFAPEAPRCSGEEYRRIVQSIVRRDSRCPSAPDLRVVVPGFRDLAEFSAAHETMLKRECGAAWKSYTQRGNWRMVFPFSRARQARVAGNLSKRVSAGLLPIVHVVDFPRLKINHALLLVAVETTAAGAVFKAYDPNQPDRPAQLQFDNEARTFRFEQNRYFRGGDVKVYEVYKNIAF